jgi:hypothetical protein
MSNRWSGARPSFDTPQAHLTAQDLELVPQHRDLHIPCDTGSEPATEDIQEPTDKQVHEPAQHRPNTARHHPRPTNDTLQA